MNGSRSPVILAMAALQGALGALGTVGAVGAVLGLAPPAVEAAPIYRQRVLVDGLRNPRGLSLDGSRLLVSEAGAGGPRLSDGSNCIQAGSGAEICSGPTGAIGLWNTLSHTYARPIANLPSLARADGSEGSGIADLWPGGPTGWLGVFGLGCDPGQATIGSLGSDWFGQVVSVDLASGAIQPRANLAAYELTNNPDGETPPNSNPYALALFGGALVAPDAGGNTAIRLDPTPDPIDGTFPILGSFVFPRIPVTPPPFPPGLPNPFPAEAVPTGLTVDPSGSTLWIGELAGYPFEPGSASVFRTDGNGAPSPALAGFTSITDLASAADGSLYVLQYAESFFQPAGNGSIWRVAPDGSRARIIDGLTQPTGLAVADDGTLYVTNNADGLQGELREYRPVVPGPLPVVGAAVAWRQARRMRRRQQPQRRRQRQAP
ncbi:MAG: ScyD/ScyE family protein [Cyanobium sp.]